MNTLHLTLIRHWFDEIASGRKTEEFRKRTPYWKKRLFKFRCCERCGVPMTLMPGTLCATCGPGGSKCARPGPPRYFHEVHFRNGYHAKAPFMRVGCNGIIQRDHPEFGQVYAIQLGSILELRNYPQP